MNLEVVVVDPNCLYSSDDEDCDISVCDNGSTNRLKLPVEQNPEQTTIMSKVHSTNDLEQSFSKENTNECVELIDCLFNFVTSNIEEKEEEDLLKEINLFESNNQNFDLAEYITDQSELLMLLPPSLQITSINNSVTEDKCKHLKLEFVEDNSEDDCKKSKKRKLDDDTLWTPMIYKKKVGADKKDIHIKVPKCVVKNENPSDAMDVANTKVLKVTDNQYGIGRGKNIATLEKYYKNTSSSDKCNRAAKNDTKSMYSNRKSNKLFKEANKVLEQIHEHNDKLSENCSNAQKELGGHKSTIHINQEINTRTDLSDFGKAIVASMTDLPTRKPNVTRRKNLQMKRLPNRFQEHSVTFQKYLKEKAAKAKILRVDSEISKTGAGNNIEPKKLPEQQRDMQAGDCKPSGKRITIDEYQRQKSLQSSTSNSSDCVIKRKITIEEYLRRKVRQPA